MASQGTGFNPKAPADYSVGNFQQFKNRKDFLKSRESLQVRIAELQSQLDVEPENNIIKSELERVQAIWDKTSVFHDVRAPANLEATIGRLERRIERIERRIQQGVERKNDGKELPELKSQVEQMKKQAEEYPGLAKKAAKGVNFIYNTFWRQPEDPISDPE